MRTEADPDACLPAHLVVGMHRSGTSALARVLGLAGLRLPAGLVQANPTNPLGHWEPLRVVRFNDLMLEQCGRHWTDPKPMPAAWAGQAADNGRIDEAVSIIRGEFDAADGIVLKDPRISRLMPVWREAVVRAGGGEPVCLIACRNPLEVCRSLRDRDGIGLANALDLWLTYMLEAEAGTRGLGRAVVHYEDLTAGWENTLCAALETAGLPPMTSIGENRAAIEAFVNSAHRHHTASMEDLDRTDEASPALRQAYRLFRDGCLSDHARAFDDIRADWLAEWGERSPGEGRSDFPQQAPIWHFERSMELLGVNRLEEAIEAGRRAGELGTDTAAYHHQMGSMLARTGKLEEAEAAQRRAIARDGSLSWPRMALGDVLDRMGRSEEAIEAVRQAIELDPGEAAFHHLLGKLLAQAERLDEAENAHERAITLDATVSWYHHALGNVAARAGRFEAAEAAQRRAIDLNGEVAWFHAALANILNRTGRTEEAVAAVDRAIELDPDRAAFHHLLGTLLANSDRLDEAEAAQRRAIGLDGTVAWFHHALGNVLARKERFEEAVAAQRRAIDLDDGVPWFHCALGEALGRIGRSRDAIAEIGKAIELSPDEARFHDLLGTTLAATRRIEEAEAAERRAIALDDSRPWFHHHLARLLFQLDRLEEAEACWRRAIALDGDVAWFHRALGDALASAGRTDEAVEATRRAAELRGGDPHFHQSLADLLARAGRFGEAARELETAARSSLIRAGLPLSWLDGGGPSADEVREIVGQWRDDDAGSAGSDARRVFAFVGARHWAREGGLAGIQDIGGADARDARLPGPDVSAARPGARERIGSGRSSARAPASIPARDVRPFRWLRERVAAWSSTRLSVMIPVYNVRPFRWLRDCVDSVLAQDMGRDDCEIVVIDDSSDDDIGPEIRNLYGDRVRYRRNRRNLGLVGNHNACLAAARGAFVHILHQDDRVEPGFYDALLAPMERESDLVAAFSNCWILDREGHRAHRPPPERAEAGRLEDWPARIAERPRVVFPSIVVRRAAYRAAGTFSPGLVYAFDWEMWGRLAALGPFWYEPRALAGYRAHEMSATHGIAIADRLVELMRVHFGLVGRRPSTDRETISVIAIDRLLRHFWEIDASSIEALGETDRLQLAHILLQGWARDANEKATCVSRENHGPAF